MRSFFISNQMLTIIAIIVFSMVSCSKDKVVNSLENQLQGKWELRMSGGFGVRTTFYIKGNGNVLSFRNNTLKVDTNNILKGNTTFSIIRKDDCEMAKQFLYLATKDNNVYYTDNIIQVINDTLHLSSTPPCGADGGFSVYVRK